MSKQETQQHSASPQLPSTEHTTDHHQEQPSDSPVVPGRAGTIGGAEETFPTKTATPSPPLPGLESYFPPLPLELDNSSKTLTPELKALFEKWDNEKPRKGACITIFPSGEITGGYYRTGRRTMPHKREKIASEEFS